MSLIATIMIKANTKHFIVICYKRLIKKVNVKIKTRIYNTINDIN